jgi:hypothetical protein
MTNTIDVAAGTYAEKINVNKSVTREQTSNERWAVREALHRKLINVGDGTNNASVTVAADIATFDGISGLMA